VTVQLELSGHVVENVEITPSPVPSMALNPDGPTVLGIGLRPIDQELGNN
jgi:hypothetical protein